MELGHEMSLDEVKFEVYKYSLDFVLLKIDLYEASA
jgi:hypothetical protein